MPEKTFKIRMYGFGELANEYKPNLTKSSAANYFNKLIKENPELKNRLENLGYKKKQQSLTPKMVSAIVEYMGEPY